MAMSECSAYSSLQADSKVNLQLSVRVGGHLALTEFRPDDLSELSHMACAVLTAQQISSSVLIK